MIEGIYNEFYTLEDYINHQRNLKKSAVSVNLVEYLIKKIMSKPNLKCMIQERKDAIIFVPVSLIEQGRAKRSDKNKNIITTWYRTNYIEIEIEDRDNKVKCINKEDINDDVLERIYTIYNNIK